MIKNMGYNLKKPIGLGMTEGILMPYTGMTKKQTDEFNWNCKVRDLTRSVGPNSRHVDPFILYLL